MISDAATKPKKRWTPKKPAEGESLPSLFASAMTSSSKPRHYVKKAPLPRPDVAPTSDTSTTTNVNMNTIRSSTIPSNANAKAKAKTSSTGNSGATATATATATPGLPSLFAASANTKHKKWTPPKRNITAKTESTTITAASSSSNVKEKEKVQQGPPPPSLSPAILAVPPIEEAKEGLVSPVPNEKSPTPAPTPAPAPPRPPKEATKASQRAAALPTTPELTLEKRKTKKTEDPPPPMASIDVILHDSHGSSDNEAWNHTNFNSTTITNANANTHANCTNISPLTIARPSSLLDRPLTTDAAEVLQILRSAELDNVSISTAGTSRNNSMEEKVQDFLADHPEAVAFVEQLGVGGDAHDKKDEEDDSVSISSVEVSSVEDSSDEGED